jgi:hypothetical protein
MSKKAAAPNSRQVNAAAAKEVGERRMWPLTRAPMKGIRSHSGLDFASRRKSYIFDSSKTIVQIINWKARSPRSCSPCAMVSAQESSWPARTRSRTARGSGDAATKILAIRRPPHLLPSLEWICEAAHTKSSLQAATSAAPAAPTQYPHGVSDAMQAATNDTAYFEVDSRSLLLHFDFHRRLGEICAADAVIGNDLAARNIRRRKEPCTRTTLADFYRASYCHTSGKRVVKA